MRGRQALQAVDVVGVVDHDQPDAGGDRVAEVAVGLRVAVQQDARRVEAGGQRDRQLAGRRDVAAEALLGEDARAPARTAAPWTRSAPRSRGARRGTRRGTRARSRAAPARRTPALASRTRPRCRPARSRRRSGGRRRRCRRCAAGSRSGSMGGDGGGRLHAVPALVRLVSHAAPRRERPGAGTHVRDRRLSRHDAAEGRQGRRRAVRRRGGDGAARRRRRGGAARPLRRGPGRGARSPAHDRADAGRAAARRGAGRRAGGRARADAAVRALRGLRRADRRALLQRCRLDRALRAGRRRAGGDGRVRHGAAQAPGGARATRNPRSRSHSARRSRARPEYPHYTRPAEWRGWSVPEVLVSGHHERIRQWRLERARERGASGGGPPLP